MASDRDVFIQLANCGYAVQQVTRGDTKIVSVGRNSGPLHQGAFKVFEAKTWAEARRKVAEHYKDELSLARTRP